MHTLYRFISFVVIFSLFAISNSLFGQGTTVLPDKVCVNCTTTQKASSVLEIQSTTEGMLIPRMTTNQRRAIKNPVKGLLVFDNTTNGFWFYNGTSWDDLRGPRGLVGATGAAGADGAPGPRGLAGATGAAGADGANGADGAAGDSHWKLNSNDTYFSTGKVGIGTTTPRHLLHLKGNAGILSLEGINRAYMQFYPDGYSAGRKAWFGYANATYNDFGITNQFTDGGLTFSTNNLIRMHIRENGNVGIGTNVNTPSARLHVVGGSIMIGNPAGTTLNMDSNGIQAKNNGQPSLLHINTEGGNLILNQKGGRVGIGTNIPSYKLHINGETLIENGWLRIKGQKGLYFQDYKGGFYMKDATWIRTFNGKSFYHDTGIMRTDGQFQVGSGGDRFFVRTDGKVGIGTKTPGAELHVSAAGLTTNDVALRVGGAGDVAVDASGVIGGRFIVKHNGNVGIGHKSPVTKLHITGGHLRAGISTTEYSEIGHGGGHGFINTIGDGNLEFRHDNTTKMKLASDGKLIIGSTSTPGDYLLYVEKGILTERVRAALKSSSRWEDDAFGKKPSLKDLEAFIQKNSHLIDMPSADELVKTGIDMVEMDANLLRQIEWLWEYTIETGKEKAVLQAENKAQNEKIQSLEKRLARLEQLLDK